MGKRVVVTCLLDVEASCTSFAQTSRSHHAARMPDLHKHVSTKSGHNQHTPPKFRFVSAIGLCVRWWCIMCVSQRRQQFHR